MAKAVLKSNDGMNDYLEDWKTNNPELNQSLLEEILESETKNPKLLTNLEKEEVLKELIEIKELQKAIDLSLSEEDQETQSF